ncbi:ABC transporter transmembrane domain-containing protein [Streptomyces iakyrus]|uniref:ABC transporter transmembrane domain-containing protein n=1 Tax=Streptomyces iakyrus TaxID=68219 RepID=UPI0033A3B8CF
MELGVDAALGVAAPDRVQEVRPRPPGLATLMVTKGVLDALGGSESLRGPILALLVLLVVGSAVMYWQWTLLGALGERVVLGARESMVRRFLGATVPAVTRRPPGELVTRVTSDTVLLHQAATGVPVGPITPYWNCGTSARPTAPAPTRRCAASPW